MRRMVMAGGLLAVYSLAVVSAYQDKPPAPRVVQVEKLKDNFFVLKGGGGNTAVLVGADGVTVVDTKNPGWGQPILDEIKKLTPKPIVRIINTHSHGDHVSGNVEFDATVDVVVQENTAVNMKKMAGPPGMGPATPPAQTIFEQNNGKGLPKRTFKGDMKIGNGADQIELRYFGRGHTNGDAWVIFPALRIMHAGDIFPGKNLPILDTNNGGSGVDLPKTLNSAADFAKNVDTIITGHSNQMTVADLREFAAFNQDFLTAVQEAKKAGKTSDELSKTWTVPAKFTGYAAPQPARLKASADAIMGELK